MFFYQSSFDFQIYRIGRDTAPVVATADVHETALAPAGSPPVLEDPAVLGVADQ